MRRLACGLALCFSGLLAVTQASAQSTASTCASGKANTLYCMPIISTENAFVVPSVGSAGLVPQLGFVPVTSAIGTQLSTFPIPSPASSLIFSFGSGGLTAQRALGPIYSDAAWTIGRHKLYVAFAYQFLDFDKIDNVSFSSIPLLLNACIGSASGPCTVNPLVQTNSHYSVSVNEYLSYASFGLTKRIGVSVTIPIVNVRSSVTTTSSVCLSEFSDNLHTLFFTPNNAKGSSSGIGDVVFGVKGTVVAGDRGAFAVGVDVRAPTGDANNFQGAGTVGVRPYIALGYRGRISPHLNFGGWINGDSILASTNGITSQHLPNSLNYNAGADFSAFRWLSLSGDYIGQTFFNAGSVAIETDQNGSGLLPSNQTFTTNTISLGLKILPVDRLLISANVLIKAGSTGLNYKPAPMIGISYTF
jgi:hypothetical protein